jgi:predicted Zn-dependent peptidase
MSATLLKHFFLASALVAGALAVPGHASAQLLPDTTLTLPGGPTVAVLQLGASEVVSIRASVPFSERPEEAGAGQLLRIQARDRMTNLADRVGATVEVHRTPSALVYQISGAGQDLDFLAWALREGMAAPESGRFDAARREVVTDLERRLETPEGALGLRLRRALAPGSVPLTGTLASLERMDPSRLTAAWARSHHRPNVRVVVAGRIDPTLVMAALADLGLPDSAPEPHIPPGEPLAEAQPAPEVIRHWVGRAYRLDGDAGATALVASRHLARVLQESPGDYEAGVELWGLETGQALVVSGAAYPRSQQAMRSRVAGLLSEGLDRLDQSRVRELAEELRSELLFAARSPWGAADLVGQGWDAGFGPDGVGVLIAALESLDEGRVRALLEGLSGTTPVQEEIRP